MVTVFDIIYSKETKKPGGAPNFKYKAVILLSWTPLWHSNMNRGPLGFHTLVPHHMYLVSFQLGLPAARKHPKSITARYTCRLLSLSAVPNSSNLSAIKIQHTPQPRKIISLWMQQRPKQLDVCQTPAGSCNSTHTLLANFHRSKWKKQKCPDQPSSPKPVTDDECGPLTQMLHRALFQMCQSHLALFKPSCLFLQHVHCPSVLLWNPCTLRRSPDRPRLFIHCELPSTISGERRSAVKPDRTVAHNAFTSGQTIGPTPDRGVSTFTNKEGGMHYISAPSKLVFFVPQQYLLCVCVSFILLFQSRCSIR